MTQDNPSAPATLDEEALVEASVPGVLTAMPPTLEQEIAAFDETYAASVKMKRADVARNCFNAGCVLWSNYWPWPDDESPPSPPAFDEATIDAADKTYRNAYNQPGRHTSPEFRYRFALAAVLAMAPSPPTTRRAASPANVIADMRWKLEGVGVLGSDDLDRLEQALALSPPAGSALDNQAATAALTDEKINEIARRKHGSRGALGGYDSDGNLRFSAEQYRQTIERWFRVGYRAAMSDTKQ